MRKLWATLLLLACAAITVGEPDYIHIRPKRVKKDLYKDLDSGLMIETQYCYEYAYGEDGILKYSEYDDKYTNQIIFHNGAHCDVVRVY